MGGLFSSKREEPEMMMMARSDNLRCCVESASDEDELEEKERCMAD
jgi:hypothetical protein